MAVAMLLFFIFKSVCTKGGLPIMYGMAKDTLQSALRASSDVPLDHTVQPLLRWDCPICAELYYRRRDWRFRSGLAADCGRMVCAANGVPADCRVER